MRFPWPLLASWVGLTSIALLSCRTVEVGGPAADPSPAAFESLVRLSPLAERAEASPPVTTASEPRDTPQIARSIAVAPLAARVPASVRSNFQYSAVHTAFGPIQPTDALFATVLDTIARAIEAQRLVYDSALGQDCSGIFHRVKDSLLAYLPLLTDTARYVYPAYAIERSSRQLADWYHRQGNLLLVHDPWAARSALRPGAVLFFGRPGRRYRDFDIEQLTDRARGFSGKGIISHVAIITAVTRDADGQVIEYTMLHGRNRKLPASRSSSGAVQSRFTKGLPPFGNWSQQWVAVARVETAVNKIGDKQLTQ